ncbi:MFS transporter, partial [Bifidobacterium sp. 64T4]|uniref:MFS transporter n=1 Tax=Bifidobacterium pongonis TaxID=2834432 RepID=UPI001C58511E
LQGATGPMISVCLIMLRDRVEDTRTYARLTALVTCTNGGIAGADALAGGWIASHLGYRAVFWAIAAVGVAGIIMLATFARDSKVERPTAMDWRGIAYLTCAVGILLMTVTALRSGSAPIMPIIGALLLAALLLATFWNHEKKTPAPLVAPDFLTRRTTWSFLLTVFIAMTGIFAIMNGLAPALAQDDAIGLGLNADGSTLVTLVPYALVGMVTALAIGSVAARSGYLKVFRIGLAITAAATALGAVAALHLTTGTLATFSAIFGLGYVGMVNVSINALGIELSPKTSPGTLPGLTAGTFNLASGISYLTLYGVQGAVTGAHGALYGYAGAMLAGAIITACALGCSALIGSKPRD